jgi:hypothetical protein
MTCIVCKGKGWYAYNIHEPDGYVKIRQKCMNCQPDATIDDWQEVGFESHTPAWMEDRETRIASGEPQWQAGEV